MTTNRLAKSETTRTGSVFSAAEWARMAEAAGQHEKAVKWWKADREGWDDAHYDPIAAAAFHQRVADKRAGR